MASVQRKLVHKQFNSPIGLYSDNNVKATLDRELKVLSNGTMGIDFDDISKPANLANSAVLRMLEEEENQKRHGRQPGGLKRVAWPPEQEYQSPSGVAQQPQQSPAQGNTHHQSSQNQYPSQYNNNARQPSHETSAVQQRSPYQQEQTNYPQPIYQQQHSQSYPTQQTQPSYQPQSYNGHQSAPVDNHPQPVYQRQHSQSQARQIRATPARVFPNPDPSFMHINRPSHLQPPQPARTVSPSTTAFAGGVAVNAPQQSQYQSPGYANSAGASPQYQPQSSPNYQQQSSPSHYQQPQSSPQYQPQSSPQYQPSPQYQSNSSLPLSPDPNISLPGWSPVRKPVQVNTGYTLNNQRPSAEPYSGQSYAGNQNQYQQQTSPSYQPSTNYNQYQPQQAPQQQQQPQYQPQQQQQYQSTPSNEHQYQAQQPYYRQPSPGIITLRKEAPFNQEPAPVFTSSPSAASFGGGTNMRGDQKWPPQEYKLQSEIDNEARRRLAQGPVLRPRRVQKDYSQFFNQHALNSTYPAYRAPPGTQHYPAH